MKLELNSKAVTALKKKEKELKNKTKQKNPVASPQANSVRIFTGGGEWGAVRFLQAPLVTVIHRLCVSISYGAL